jgi:hypothetical protein
MNFRNAGVVCALAGLLSGCSGSLLIRPDDSTFPKAQQHLASTIQTVAQLGAAPAERALFLQAESFYRYRFDAPPRSLGSYAAEAAAAITDFPAFQSLAGSLDLLDLRYRAPDSAVQLWETLLEKYPQTPLRSLTLYRLGWAYRSAGASGLPRQSPDDAFDQLIREQPATALAGLARDAKSVSWKSKSTAAVRSLIPGLGQMYLGESRSGWTRLGIAAAALAVVVASGYAATRRSDGQFGRSNLPLVVTGVAGLVVLSFDYTSSYEDAMAGVVRWNERAESDFELSHPSSP